MCAVLLANIIQDISRARARPPAHSGEGDNTWGPITELSGSVMPSRLPQPPGRDAPPSWTLHGFRRPLGKGLGFRAREGAGTTRRARRSSTSR